MLELATEEDDPILKSTYTSIYELAEALRYHRTEILSIPDMQEALSQHQIYEMMRQDEPLFAMRALLAAAACPWALPLRLVLHEYVCSHTDLRCYLKGEARVDATWEPDYLRLAAAKDLSMEQTYRGGATGIAFGLHDCLSSALTDSTLMESMGVRLGGNLRSMTNRFMAFKTVVEEAALPSSYDLRLALLKFVQNQGPTLECYLTEEAKNLQVEVLAPH